MTRPIHLKCGQDEYGRGEAMRTRYHYIHFVEIEKKRKTSVWSCRNNRTGGELGRVEWYGPWRQYCYAPTGPPVAGQVIYSEGCLADIIAFLKQLSYARRAM